MFRRVLALVSLVILVTITCFGGQFQFYRTDRTVAIFINGTTETFSGLWVKFPTTVAPIQTLGIGADLTLMSNEEGVLRFMGAIPPLTTWEIDWPLEGPAVSDAAWIRADGSEVPINTHAPIAQIQMSFPLSFWLPCPGGRQIPYFPVGVDFSAQGSYDPDEASLTSYEWEWSDGFCATGRKVTRWFNKPGRYSVTLTVWDIQGYSDTITKTFRIPKWKCSSQP